MTDMSIQRIQRIIIGAFGIIVAIPGLPTLLAPRGLTRRGGCAPLVLASPWLSWLRRPLLYAEFAGAVLLSGRWLLFFSCSGSCLDSCSTPSTGMQAFGSAGL